MITKNVTYDQYLKEVNQKLAQGGIFLTSHGKKSNTMIIGWGGITRFWNKPIFIAPVRQSRYTHDIIDSTGEFTISIPLNKDLKKEIAFCGSKSGRDYDKFEECNLTPIPSQNIDAPIIGECDLHYECRVVYKHLMDANFLNEDIDKRWYPDYHTMFFGEILACYITE